MEKIEYKKAYVELYEIIQVLPKKEKEKIPIVVLKNLEDNMDKEYNFTLDTEKSILNQHYKDETKALFVELYERYLAEDEEKDFWKKYDKVCLNMIEEEKTKKYDVENIFGNRNIDKEKTTEDENINNSNLLMQINKDNILTKFIKFMKKIFRLK